MNPRSNLFYHPGSHRPSSAALHVFTILLSAWLSGGFAVRVRAGDSSAPPVVPVQPAGLPAMRALSESDLITLLTTTLQRDYVKDRGVLELNLKQPWIAPMLPEEPLTLKILELPTSGVMSAFIIRFELGTTRETLGTWQTTVQAHVWREVWMAHANLHRGEPVNGADIMRERCDVLNVREALAEFSPDDDSLELAAPAAAGTPLLARMIKVRAVIHRGQVTNALIQDGALSITTKVEALEDGAPGQMIHARNSISRRVLNGRVLDSQTILISL